MNRSVRRTDAPALTCRRCETRFATCVCPPTIIVSQPPQRGHPINRWCCGVGTSKNRKRRFVTQCRAICVTRKAKWVRQWMDEFVPLCSGRGPRYPPCRDRTGCIKLLPALFGSALAQKKEFGNGQDPRNLGMRPRARSGSTSEEPREAWGPTGSLESKERLLMEG